MLVVGLSGDVGAGKSTVAALYREMGATVVSADDVVGELWLGRELRNAVWERYGDAVFTADGELRRQEIARRIFGDDGEYRWLTGLIHPRVRAEMGRRVNAAHGWVVAEIPLLFENSPAWWIDRTLYITAPAEQRGRWNSARHLDRQKITMRERWMLESEAKQRRADDLLANSGTLEELHSKARRLAERYRALLAYRWCRIGGLRPAELPLVRQALHRHRAVEPLCTPGEPAGLSCLLPEEAFHPLAEDLSRRLGRQAPLVVTELRRLSRGTQQRILEALDHEGHHISPRG